MDENEYINVFAIPANYTDSGRLLGGMLEVRNTIEAIVIVVLIGYPELMWLPFSGKIKIVVMTVTLLPIGVLSLMGISGDSLLQYLGHIIRHWRHRRKISFRRIGYRDKIDNEDQREEKDKTRKKRMWFCKQKHNEEQTDVCSGFHSGETDS